MRTFAVVIASLPFVLAPSSHAASAPVQTISIRLEDPTTDPSIVKMQLVADHDTVDDARRARLEIDHARGVDTAVG